MTDVFDQAQEAEAKFREQALKAQAKHDSMPPVGFCYNCDAPLSNSLGETTSHSTRLQTTAAKSLVIPQAGERTNEKGYLQSLGCFCDSDCRDDYEYRENRPR